METSDELSAMTIEATAASTQLAMIYRRAHLLDYFGMDSPLVYRITWTLKTTSLSEKLKHGRALWFGTVVVLLLGSWCRLGVAGVALQGNISVGKGGRA